MNIPQRFREQYVANLRAYRRTAPARFVWLILATGFAMTMGGLLHATKDIPLLFYPLIAFLALVTTILVVVKLVRLALRTRDESRYIFQGDLPVDERRKLAMPTESVSVDGALQPLQPHFPDHQETPRSSYSGVIIVAAVLLPFLCLGGGTVVAVGVLWSTWRAPMAPPNNVPAQRPKDDILDHHRDAIRRMEQSTQALEQQLRRQEEALRRNR